MKFPLIDENTILIYGKFILTILEEEYNALVNNIKSSICVWCILRQLNSGYQIPCWHTIVFGNIYPPELFHKRYLHLDQTIECSELNDSCG